MSALVDRLVLICESLWRPVILAAAACAVLAGLLRAFGLADASTLAIYVLYVLSVVGVGLGVVSLGGEPEPATVPIAPMSEESP